LIEAGEGTEASVSDIAILLDEEAKGVAQDGLTARAPAVNGERHWPLLL